MAQKDRTLTLGDGSEAQRCECPDPDHDCQNVGTEPGDPRMCTPCLYGCAP